MSKITKTKEGMQKETINHVKYQLTKMLVNLMDSKREIPAEIDTLVNKWITELDTIQLEDTPKTTLTEGITSKEEILYLIKTASAYADWKIDSTEELNPRKIEKLKKDYGIEFDETVIPRYTFYRKVKRRDLVYLIELTALPGYFDVNLYTDCVDYGPDGLISTDEFVKFVQKECQL